MNYWLLNKIGLGFIVCLSTVWFSSCAGSKTFFLPAQVKAAEQALEVGNYSRAAELFAAHLNEKPNDHKVRARYGISLFLLSNIKEAAEQLNYSINRNKRPTADDFYYLASALHYQQDFSQAADHYKNFLRKSKAKDIRNAEVMAQLSRCFQGLQQSFIRPIAIVANMGPLVNSPEDEILPVISPSNSDRIYYSSKRDHNDLAFSLEGTVFNMFGTEISNGIWQRPTKFLPKYQTGEHEILQAINPSGTVLLFTRGGSVTKSTLYVDSFELNQTLPFIFEAPIITEYGDKDLYMANDSVILFSSRRLSGYGGYDLYYTLHANGKWLEPINLGPEINSEYDEISPFLSRDGRTLYFSCNNRESIGGFDIFKTFFSDQTMRWSVPKNAGLPINSALDDQHFRLATDGKRTLFSSNRLDGQGGFDLYIGTLRDAASEQLMSLAPFYLFDEKAFALIAEATRADSSIPEEIPRGTDLPKTPQVKTLSVEHLFFRETDLGLSEPNKIKLDLLSQYMIEYPELILELRSHLPSDGNKTFQMYSSLDQADKVFRYLVTKKINPSRIITKGLGDQYPIAKEIVDGKENPSAAFLNRRVETILHKEPSSIRIVQEYPEVSPFMRSDNHTRYTNKIKGLSYKIQFVSLRQMYSGDLMDIFSDATIERIGDAEIIQYSVGLFKTLSEALKTREDVARRGFKDAFLVVYINGLKINRSEITSAITDQYPDLINYLKYTE